MHPCVPVSTYSSQYLRRRSASPRPPSRCAGFTLVETLVTLGIAGILSSIAYPSLNGHLLRARRADALVALLQAQLAEERFRAGHAAYGDLADIGVGATSSAGLYVLSVDAAAADGYRIVATAAGAQARDTDCRTLRLEVGAAGVAYTSGPDAATANAADVNRRCWNR